MLRIAWVLIFFSSCTSISYSYRQGLTKIQAIEEPELSGQTRWSHGTHKISGMDSSGGFCASLGTGLDAATARQDAIDKASPYDGSITYNYRVHTAREYTGARCGSFFRWGSSENVDYFPSNSFGVERGTYKSKNSLIEGGLVFDYGEPLFEGVVISPRARVSVGVWEIEGQEVSGSYKFGDFSFGAQLHIVPAYLFGFGIHPFADFNLANFSFSFGSEVGYTLALGTDFSIQIGGLWEESESAWPAQYALLTRSFGGYARVGYFW